jgi:RNA polymerase sigma-70 factor (ECF subfamily)
MTDMAEEISDGIVALLPRLRRFARTLTRHQHDADDLTQIVVERALRHRAQFRPGASLAAWLFGIMKNAWLDSRRAHTRRGETLEIPIGTLTSRLARGRAALAAALGDTA